MVEHLGQFIRRTRQSRGLTQERLAELSDVSRWQLAQMERGENVSVAFLLKVARSLELTEIPLDFLTVYPVLPDTPALLVAAEAADVILAALQRVQEASADIKRAAESIDALLVRPVVPGDAQRRIAAAAERLAAAPPEQTAAIGRALRRSADSSAKPARAPRRRTR